MPVIQDGGPSFTERCRALLVGSDAGQLATLGNLLSGEGGAIVEVQTDPRLVLLTFRDFQPDVVVMQCGPVVDADALAVAGQLHAEVHDNAFLPFVLFCPDARPELTHTARIAPFPVFYEDGRDAAELSRVVLQLHRPRAASQRAIERAETESDRAKLMEVSMVQQLAKLAECRDHPDTGHVFRVGRLAAEIGSVMGLSKDEVHLIRHAAPLHDVGKLRIDQAILDKDDLLTLDEMDAVKKHTILGAALLGGGRSRILAMAETIALFHHENWDGTGYTPGLAGTDIPLAGRIVRVADTFDASTHPRPFADKLAAQSATEFIRKSAGRLFDPVVVEAFLEVRDRGVEVDQLIAAGLV